MASAKERSAERKRGVNEAHSQYEALFALWPKAFPRRSCDVRPLARSMAKMIAPSLGWSVLYAEGVLSAWKSRAAYCRAVLTYSERIALDGSALGQEVDDKSRNLASKRLAALEARRAEKKVNPDKGA